MESLTPHNKLLPFWPSGDPLVPPHARTDGRTAFRYSLSLSPKRLTANLFFAETIYQTCFSCGSPLLLLFTSPCVVRAHSAAVSCLQATRVVSFSLSKKLFCCCLRHSQYNQSLGVGQSLHTHTHPGGRTQTHTDTHGVWTYNKPVE